MRRAEARRSASVMIRSSIRWSLAGNDVDWMMKTSEPRTFSWISTKISMSAKRRTTALVSGTCSQSEISCAKAGLELPATSLIEPFLADIDNSPRVLLETMFSISGYPQNRHVYDERGDIKEVAPLATRRDRFSCAKSVAADISLAGAVGERHRSIRSGRDRVGAAHRRAAAPARRCGRRLIRGRRA